MAGDQDDFPIETVEGLRPRGTFGERLLIGVAGVALLGGVLVAVGNVLPEAPEAARASPSAAAISSGPAHPSPTPRTRREPRTVTLARVPEFTQMPFDDVFYGWIRTTGEVPLYPQADDQLTPTETLPPGYVAHASGMGGPGTEGLENWLSIDTAMPSGWIDASDPALVERFSEAAAYRGSTDLYGIAAGPNGFVAWGSDARGGVVIYGSADGATWSPGEVPTIGNGYMVGAAHGPVGWVAVVQAMADDWRPLTVLLQSEDGIRWTAWGAFEQLINVTQILGTPSGYVVTDYASGFSEVWTSTDAVEWHEQQAPAMSSSPTMAWSTGDGFVLNGSAHEAPFSRDGVTWLPGNDGPGGERMRVIELWDGLLAVDEGLDGTPRTWRGIIGRQAVTWDLLEESGLQETRLTALVEDGDQGLAIGWDTSTGEAVAWRMTVSGWRREPFPSDELGGVPVLAAGGRQGVVAVGYRPTLGGVNPVIWHLADRRWLPEAEPVVPPAADPAEGACEPLPTDVLAFMTLDVLHAVACHGATPTTFRAYTLLGGCPGCYGASEDVFEPRWLADYGAEPSLLISPVADADWGGQPVAIHPSLAYDPAWAAGHAVEITGHFDDPAAAECRMVPGPRSVPWRLVPQEVVNGCRTRFVATEVTVVD